MFTLIEVLPIVLIFVMECKKTREYKKRVLHTHIFHTIYCNIFQTHLGVLVTYFKAFGIRSSYLKLIKHISIFETLVIQKLFHMNSTCTIVSREINLHSSLIFSQFSNQGSLRPHRLRGQQRHQLLYVAPHMGFQPMYLRMKSIDVLLTKTNCN